MDIEGTYTLQATPDEVWRILGNRETLLQILPEIQQLEPIDEFSHSLALKISYPQLVGTYFGTVRLEQLHAPTHAHIVIESVRDTQNTLTGEAYLDLQAQDNTTVVTYTGDVTFHKSGILLQRTVIKGAAKLLVSQFFTSLEVELRKQQAERKRVEEEAARKLLRNVRMDGRVRPEPTTRLSFLRRIVRLLHIGSGEAADEIRWAQRIRNTWYASMLLFLVWVGTRIIPRN